MTIDELYEKQRQEINDLLKVKEKIWKKMYEDQQAMVSAFGSFDNIPDDYKQRIRHEYQEFHREWDLETGIHYPTLKKRHTQQRINQSEGKPVYQTPFQPNKLYPENQTDRERKKQELIDQQREVVQRQKSKYKNRERER